MFKYVIFCLCINLCYVICDLNKEEGAECEWDGVKGQCVRETRCLTTLDTMNPEPPVCSTKGENKIICCTDCDLVNDTRNVVFSPKSGIFWKDGTKARDNCLQYIDQLPYECRSGGFYSGIKRQLNENKKCHVFGLWGIGGAPPHGQKPGAQYPHQVLLGYGGNLETAKWLAGGSLISDRYILTAAHVNRNVGDDQLTYVALDVKNRSDSPSTWQTHKIKRFITAPEFKSPQKYHDIALIETDTIHLEKFTDEECKTAFNAYRLLAKGIDVKTQVCYGSRTNSPEACRGLSGEPLLVETQFSCAYAVIGVTSFGQRCDAKSYNPDVFTKIAPYVPWIESVVWP